MHAREKIALLEESIEKVIYGKSDVVKRVVAGLLARGHLLIEDVPGIGKTTLARVLARSIHCSFKRIQFTNDMLPADVLGVNIYDQREKRFDFKRGPIFANIVLADEINRTTPKTQSCLLEAMNDLQVSVDGQTYRLPVPFLVLATQNPVEFHGTYPLPEAQLDRFMLRIRIGYPPESDEKRILVDQPSGVVDQIEAALSVDEVLQLQDAVERVRLEDGLIAYLLSIVRATREYPHIELGISPRGGLHLYRAAKALALTEGRDYCIPDDIKSLAVPALAHRIVLAADGMPYEEQTKESENVIADIVNAVPVPL